MTSTFLEENERVEVFCPAIAKCTDEQLNLLQELENECFFKPYSQKILHDMLKNPLAFVLRADLQGVAVGYVAVERAFDEAEVVKIAVKKEYRRRKIASFLLDCATAEMQKKGVKKLFLEVDETNDGALSLYKSCGFSIIAVREKYYGDRAAVIMQKNL